MSSDERALQKKMSASFKGLGRFYETNFRLVRLMVFACLILLAWFNRFIQDDAFISFRYADNFARGLGLVWNEGERIEGYTNFLWTMLMSVPIRLGLDPVKFSYCLGLILLTVSLIFTYKLAQIIFNSRNAALLTLMLLGTNYTFSSYATGGLETQLQACLFVTSIYLLKRAIESGAWSMARLITLSLLLSASVLTRLDSALLVVIVLPVAACHLFKEQTEAKEKLIKLLSLLLPLAVTVGSWFIWKLSYYGDILPNTFYAKVSSVASLKQGFIYVFIFFQSYWLTPFVLLFLFYCGRHLRRAGHGILVASATVALWLLYVIEVGGDFMEFRFIVPVMPLIFILIAWIICVRLRRIELKLALVALIFAGSLQHALWFTSPYGVEDIEHLNAHVTSPEGDWEGVGKLFGKTFGDNPNVTIATQAAGAIPYYSRLKTIDMLGMSDPFVARSGRIIGTRPGHQRNAPLDYLINRRVNFVLGEPQVVAKDFPASILTDTRAELSRFVASISDEDRFPLGSRIIEMPLSATHKLFVLYLVTDPRLDQLIAQSGWRTYFIAVPDQDGAGHPRHCPLYLNGTRVSLAQTEADKYLWYGWSSREPSARWTDRNSAAIIFALDEIKPGVLRIRLAPFLAAGKLTSQRVRLELNGQTLATWTLNQSEPKEFAINLPPEFLRKENILTFILPDAQSPKNLNVSEDSRLLGINVEWFEIDAAGQK